MPTSAKLLATVLLVLVPHSIQAQESGHSTSAPRRIAGLSEDADADAIRFFDQAQKSAARGRFEEAAELYHKASLLNVDWVDPLVARAKINSKLGRYEDVVEDATEALLLRHSDAMLLNLRGYARYNLDQFEKAITDFTEAIRVKPAFFEAYINRGNAKWQLADKQGANADFAAARSLNNKTKR